MICPALDLTTYLMLSRMKPGKHAFTGPTAASCLLASKPKPVVVVVATDAPKPEADTLRKIAMIRGVPVVHALSADWLGQAVRSTSPEVCVTVVHIPHHVKKVAANFIALASEACAAFMREITRSDRRVDALTAQMAHASL